MDRKSFIDDILVFMSTYTSGDREVSTVNMMEKINEKFPNWKLVFDAPTICEYDEELSDNVINDIINKYGWDSHNTHEENVKAIKNRFNNEKEEQEKYLKDFYKLKKIKPSDSIYSEANLNPNIVNNILLFEGTTAWHRTQEIGVLYRRTVFNNNNTHEYSNQLGLGLLLYTMNRIPNLYIVCYKPERHTYYSFLFYKKAKNLKLEHNSIEALRLIENISNVVDFFSAFGMNKEYHEQELIGKFNTKSYAHLSINILNEVICVMDNQKYRDRMNQLVGLGATSFQNRLIQYYLQDNSIEDIKSNYKFRNENITEEHIKEAIDILEKRYQSYKASQLKKKAS